MATQSSRTAARFMMAPAVVLLLGWMLVPLVMTLYFSFKRYLPLRGGDQGWVGFENYVRFVTSSAFWPSVLAFLAAKKPSDLSISVRSKILRKR